MSIPSSIADPSGQSGSSTSASPAASAASAELAKAYAFREAEPQVRQRWNESRCFHAVPGTAAQPFCILIPPPNVTAALHLGHAFNNSLQDVLVRWHRMRGFATLWMPGTDHAGIATQAVVEKRLLAEGKRRTDFTREQFVARVQAWKDEYEATILSQLEAMGASCDFERTRFTMDPVCAAAVREAFFRLFRDGLIYRGKRLVNWDPVSQTALADDEVEMEEVDGAMHYLRYPLVDPPAGGPTHVTVATTRPETMLGDTAVAVNPKDPRAAALRGRRLRLPIVGREIPIVEDDYVVLPAEIAAQVGGDPDDPKAAFATGFLKVTPAHDPNDWEIGVRHGLAVINVFAPDATISDRHGWEDVSDEARPLLGLSREEARKRVVAWFKERGLLEAVKPYRHSVGHSYRSHVPIEPYLSDQWYVRVTDERMRGAALGAMAQRSAAPSDLPSPASGRGCREAAGEGVSDRKESRPPLDAPHPAAAPPPSPASGRGDGQLLFFPERYARTFQLWHENLRDWCISRQLWWGHRIPVWTAAAIPSDLAARIEAWRSAGRVAVAFGAERVDLCVRDPEGQDAMVVREIEAAGFTRDPDVLDTWFSSALWPISTMGWPQPGDFPREIPEGPSLLDTFNPSTVLFTAREILTLWVSRMVMFNRYFREGHLPFRNVFIHAVIQDGHGQKMSKSLGNGVDPRDIISTHGADAMRFVLVQISTGAQDVRLPVDILDPHSGEPFAPRTFTDAAGYVVAEPIQTSPRDPSRKLVSFYGMATGKATPTAEMPLALNTSSRFDAGRNFCNKLWNATRFALANLAGEGSAAAIDGQPVRLVDRWILSRLHAALHAVEAALGSYRFGDCADALYDFVWRDFCDWYLEASKPTVRSDPLQQQVLLTVLDAALRLLHPIVPFVTETLWPHVQTAGRSGGRRGAGLHGVALPPSELCAVAAWPRIDGAVHDREAMDVFPRVQELVNAIRNLRGERQVQPKRRIVLHGPPATLELIRRAEGVVEQIAGLERVEPIAGSPPAGAVAIPFEGQEVLLSGLVDAIDAGAERARLDKEIGTLERAIAGFRGKLDNAGYVAKAPPAVVEETRIKLRAAEADLAAAQRARERC